MMEANAFVALSESMAQAVAKAAASTVRVAARKGLSASGTAIRPELILTANHVVERDRDVRVQLPDGQETGAQVLGRDPGMDLCVLRLEGDLARACQPAGEEAQVGQFVLALGRPDGEGIQASMGVVGAVGGLLRLSNGGLLERFIRTDAIPYPGFSGGPLVDGDGLVVGINTSGFTPGASLAIPAAAAWQAAELLRQQGRIRRGFLGISSQPVDLPPGAVGLLGREQRQGLLLVSVERGRPADQAGWMVGDILLNLDGHNMERQEALMQYLAGNVAGKTAQAEILHGGKLVRSSVQIGER